MSTRKKQHTRVPDRDTPAPSGLLKVLLPWILVLVVAAVVVGFGLDLGGESTRGSQSVQSAQESSATGSATTPSPQRAASALDTSALATRPQPQAPPTRASNVSFDPPLIQWGFLKPGEVKVLEATVTNEGHEPIRFTGEMKGCSCTKVDIAAVEVAPGESLPFRATMTAGLTPTTKKSKISLTLQDHVAISVPTDGEIVRGIRVSPRRVSAVNRNRQDPDGPGTAATLRRVRFDAPDGRPFRVLRVDGVDAASFPLGAGLLHPKPVHSFIFDDFNQFDPVTGLNAKGEPIKLFRLLETDHPDAAVIELPIDHPMRIAQLQRRGDRPWFFVENRFVADTVAPGDSTIVDVPLLVDTRLPWEAPTQVRSLSDDFEARLVELVAIGRKQRARIEITPRLVGDGAYIGDIQFESPNFSVTVPLIGAVRTGNNAP
jgi:hypothetical protein